jgi:hypothetical protein
MPFSNGSFGGLYSAGMSAARILILAALFLAAAGPLSPSQAQSCVGRQEARQLIQQGQAVSLAVALQRAGISSDQLAGDPQLCQSGGGFAYRVQVVQDGQVSSVTIPAN